MTRHNEAKTIINLSDDSEIKSKSGCIGYFYGFSFQKQMCYIPQRNHSGIYIQPDESNASFFYERSLNESHWECIKIKSIQSDELILRESTIDRDLGEISFPDSLEHKYAKFPLQELIEIDSLMPPAYLKEIDRMFTDKFNSMTP